MTVTLDMSKGDTVVLKGENKIVDALLGLGWDPATAPGVEFDLDAVLMGRDTAGTTRAEWVVYFKQLDVKWAKHSGDSLSGVGEMDASGDDEQITVHLGQVPAEIDHLDAYVIIYNAKARKQTFGDLSKAHVRLTNADGSGKELKFALTADELFAGEGMLFAQIVRHGPTWEFKAVAQTRPEFGSINDAANYTSPVVP